MSPLPMPPVWDLPLPEAAPPPGMAIYQLPTGTYDTRAIFAFRGGSFRDKRHFAATAILVQHPKGDLGSRTASSNPRWPPSPHT